MHPPTPIRPIHTCLPTGTQFSDATNLCNHPYLPTLIHTLLNLPTIYVSLTGASTTPNQTLVYCIPIKTKSHPSTIRVLLHCAPRPIHTHSCLSTTIYIHIHPPTATLICNHFHLPTPTNFSGVINSAPIHTHTHYTISTAIHTQSHLPFFKC